jgi:hypothetical protein
MVDTRTGERAAVELDLSRLSTLVVVGIAWYAD